MSPLTVFNVARFIEPSAIMPFMISYMRASGFDVKATITIDEKNRKEIKGNPQEAVPRWFPQYFQTSLSRQLGLPYTMYMKDVTGWQQFIPPALSMVKAFKDSSYPTPADAFALNKVVPGTLTAQDALKLQSFLRDAFSFQGLQKSTNFGSSDTDRIKTESNSMILGHEIQPGSTVYDTGKTQPTQYVDATERFKKTIAEIAPYLDAKQAATLINFARGKDEDGFGNVPLKAAFAKTPNVDIVGNALVQAPGYRTLNLLKGVGYQIRTGKKLPPIQYREGSSFQATTKYIADQQKFFKKTLMLQRRQLEQSRFE